jgi:hypothetical protein
MDEMKGGKQLVKREAALVNQRISLVNPKVIK